MDRCALFVDAGYLLADGAMAVHGTRRRDAVSWDYSRLLELLNQLAVERAQLPLLRCYWYEATPEGRRAPEHDALADVPGLKLRLGRVRPGGREGVDLMAYRDLTTLAREHAICDAVLVSGSEDMVHAVGDAQDYGVRVLGMHVAVDGNWTISRALRQECDDLIEIAAAQLRPYVNLLHGVDTSSPPLSNGQAPPGPRSSHLQAPASGGRGRTHSTGHSGPQPLPSTSSGHRGRHHSTPHLMPGHPSGPTYVPQHESGSISLDPGEKPRETPQPPERPQPPQPELTGQQEAQQPSSAPTLSDAVRAAHKEGRDFGASVARDAPALWLEAVLARKPRMPSDLEARLLQGSTLPIDFLLHDDVRHALRRGFWEALEQSRRT